MCCYFTVKKIVQFKIISIYLKRQYIFENKYVLLCLETLIHFNCEVFTKTLLKPVLPNKL